MESEWATRRTRIDPQLRAAGWSVVPFDPAQPLEGHAAHAIAEFPTANGPADYALALDGRVVGIIEAKKLSVGPGGVLVQADRYARGLPAGPFDFAGVRAPFLLASSGEEIRFHDARHPLNTSRPVACFPTPSALREALGRDLDAACRWLAEHPDAHPWMRPYQKEAVAAVEQAVRDRKREMLLAMATGTGKTATAVNLVYRLIKSGVARRVLFLVDRRALAAQTVRAFASFDAEPNRKFKDVYSVFSQKFRREDFGEDEAFDPTVLPNDHLADPQPRHTFVYVCTIQRMAVNLLGRSAAWGGEGDELDDDADRLDLPIHAFDVVIADECHRGYTSQEVSAWRTVLDHFDAVRVGLTATPAPHTLGYFKHKAYEYGYARAVREGHLVDYDTVKLSSGVRLEGVRLEEGENVQYIDPETGSDDRFDKIEDERDFAPAELERLVTSPDSNRKILEELKRHAEAHEARTGRFPKTLIFALHDLPHISHADALADLARDVFGRGEGFVQKITGRTDRPLQRIREFRNRTDRPGIVVSVDLMSTGVDIPDLEFLVFLRPVRSRILFEQMLGRGTRKGEQFPDKSHFVVVDCFDGQLLASFRDKSMMAAEPPDKPSRPVEEVIEDVWANRDRAYNVRCLVKRLQRIDKEMSAEAREDFKRAGVPDGDVGRWAAGLAQALATDFTGQMARLRDPAFQRLLTGYKRRPKVFIRAIGNVDKVSSEYVFRDAEGREARPGDYLEEFSRFVRENPERIEAIGILLARPAGWGVEALEELRRRLRASPRGFDPDRLENAHRIQHGIPGIDLVSMVKHAADASVPLLTASERAARAVERAGAGRQDTPAGAEWLGRLRDHLAANLSIDSADFDAVPVLADAGGWRAAEKALGGGLAALVARLNEEFAR